MLLGSICYLQKPFFNGKSPGEGGESMMSLKALFEMFEILGGIDTTLELCKKVACGIKWSIHTIQNVVHKIRTARKK